MKLTNTEVCKCPQLDLSSNHPLQVIAVVRILLSAPDSWFPLFYQFNQPHCLLSQGQKCIVEKMKANVFCQSKILKTIFLHLMVCVNSAPLYSCFR